VKTKIYSPQLLPKINPSTILIYQTHTPAFPLCNFIESFVYYKGYNPDHSVDRFLPDGYCYVVFDLTDYPKYIYDNHTLKEIQSCKNVWFSGIRENFITIPSGRDSEMFIIYFQKGKAYPFVEMPMHELTDFVVDGELVMSPEILDLRDALLTCATVHQKFMYAEKYLTKNPFVDFSVAAILQNPRQQSIRVLADKVGFSQKHFTKIFKEHVGLTPKAFMRIIRFQHAIREIEKHKTANWTSIAFESGYFDQAHFINDFKSFSGFTPQQYLRMQSDFTNYIAVG
jgi:AraC-like DNA-binding protein